MSDRIELLAILLSGLLHPRRIDKRQQKPAPDPLLASNLHASRPANTNERPTLRLLRLVGRDFERPRYK
jgi:hypothetical protein